MIIQRQYNKKSVYNIMIRLFSNKKIIYLQIIKRQLIFKTTQSSHTTQMSQQIIKFLNKYTITHIDDHTSIISEYEHPIDYGNKNRYVDQSSLSFLMTDSRKYKNTYVNSSLPVCFLVKDLIIEDQNQMDLPDTDRNGTNKRLEGALETLSMHQQLSNKYILTLIHYQVFKKSIPNCNSQSAHIVSNYQHQNLNENQQVAHFPLGLHRQKQKIIKTRIQQSSYHEQSMDGDSFVQNYREKSITHFSQCNNNQNRSHNAHINTNANVQTNINTNVSLNLVSSELRTAIRAIYQYGKITLKQEIKNRIISNTQFQQEELWAILATLVQALSYLEEQGIVYGVLGTDKIFINNSLVKILDPSATATDPLLIAEGRLYSPQILNDEQNIDMFKSDVYIIGMVLIECSLLINLSKEVEPNMNKYLSLFRQAYSQQLVDIVRLCLAVDPKDRPSFQDLKKYLAKQLDMNDFESAYDNTGARILQPLQNDQQDIYNSTVSQIQIEFQQDHHDVLYQSIGEQQLKNRRRNLTEYDRARLRYLGSSLINQIQGSSNSSGNNSQSRSGQKTNIRMHSQHKHRYTSSSPLQTKKNSKLPQQDNTAYFNFNNVHVNGNGKALPNLNVAISQSIYPDQNYIKNNPNTQKTNRKYHKKPENDYELNWMKAEKQNRGQQKTVPNSNEKQRLTKTRQIKQKLVRPQNTENNLIDQTFGPKNNKTPVPSSSNKDKPKIKPQIPNNSYYSTNNANKYQNSQIRQQVQQQSESSYIYYNNTSNTNSNKMLKNKNGSIGNSQISKNSQLSNSNSNIYANKMLKNSNRYRHTQYEEQNYSNNNANKQNNQYQYTSTDCNKLMNKIKEDQLFTDPNLLKTIKDDLARISTKNIRLMDKNKDKEKQRERQKYFN